MVHRRGASATAQDDRDRILQNIESRAAHFGELSRKIWDFAELGYKETRSAELLKSELRSAGFQIQDNIASISTAFTASWGSGSPVIGILGEYDALPGLSQDAIPEKKPLVAGAAGHGCGHNLLGAASALAAIALKDFLTERKLSGTIRFYGTPAEEGGGGKIYMARAGAFRDCDLILAWHPGGQNYAGWRNSLATISAKFRFRGKAAHAAISPDQGRSALDAVALMNHAVELLREHVPESTRMHYIVTHGGAAPNIVPDFAELYYQARYPDMPVLDGIWSRIVKCAEAAALATETQLEMEIINSTYNVLPNDTLNTLLDRNLRTVGGVRYSMEEQTFAERIRATFSTEGSPPLGSEAQIQTADAARDSGSSDVGDVSWLVPTGHLWTATFVPGTSLHSWQSTACSGTSIGRKGMLVAAKTLALTAADVFLEPKKLELVRSDFNRRRGTAEYRSRIPPNQKPPLNYRDK